ncbi:hypothetical protein MLD38_018399 [Melastoma candidum]|uniref:Uncharacterized protein n=1 Tax=Melastoma candidum TaxID=119954 RepID=A0ACB9R1Y3_9MYRT|nr:hypothetical protein MLD38_018399 [Melastoma candidum]
MTRRRLRLGCSSDEEEDSPLFQEPADSANSASLPVALEISDDDAEFVDVPEELDGGGAARPSFPGHESMVAHLERMGLRLSNAWVDGLQLQTSVPGFSHLDAASKAKICFQHFLRSDMNSSGGGVLPPNVGSLHQVDLAGPFVLQVDEIVNISCPIRDRYQNASVGPKRCLKLSMTDGIQRVFGMEYRPMEMLEPLAPAGLKVAMSNVHIRHGLLMLVPEVLVVLGGVVDELEAARQRLVEEVNKPPRGKRTRSGVTPSLATRATAAAWPHNPNAMEQNGSVGTVQSVVSQTTRGSNLPHTPVEVGPNPRISDLWTAHNNGQPPIPSPSSNFISDFEDMHMDTASASPSAGPSANAEAVFERVDYDSAPSAAPTMSNSGLGVVSSASDMHCDRLSPERLDADLDPPRTAFNLIGEDAVRYEEHPQVGDDDRPFTYIASLSTKWATLRGHTSSVQGKVKCLLTGVKGFQYKHRTSYELCVYIDDGSLISEILIHHDVVERGIGHSPQAVTTALSSSNSTIVSNMKETLKRFQSFLADFEGVMLIEIGETSPFPIALEMDKGCSTSDAWMLLERLKTSTAATEQPFLGPICLSP